MKQFAVITHKKTFHTYTTCNSRLKVRWLHFLIVRLEAHIYSFNGQRLCYVISWKIMVKKKFRPSLKIRNWISRRLNMVRSIVFTDKKEPFTHGLLINFFLYNYLELIQHNEGFQSFLSLIRKKFHNVFGVEPTC